MATDHPDHIAEGRSPADWQLSSYCAANGCIAVHFGTEVRVRDSKLTAGPELVFDAEEWRAFVAGVKAGEFDL